jgi:ubiquinone/menaquinone biosynthesis C-methylase UbiE
LLNQRVIVPELLDHAPDDVAHRNLGDLTKINRWLGGHRILRNLMRPLARPDEAFTFLDVGAASGDMGRIIQRHYPRATIISLDRQARNLRQAPQPRLVGDAFRLPVRAADFVHCSLFLHHFTNDEVVELLRSFAAVARRAVVIQDLERHILAHRFLPATKHIFGWNALTLHDGPVSVAAAFRADELRQIAQTAGLKNARIRTHGLSFRLSLVAGPALPTVSPNP